jgi:arylformamidase
MIYDISPLLRPELPVWPGDEPFRASFQATLEAGDGANVGCFGATTHLGAHVDAPLHTEPGGISIDRVPIEVFLGPCRVLDVPPLALLGPELLAQIPNSAPPRLLLKTRSLPDRSRFSPHFTALSPELARALATSHLRLLGLDTPSVDPWGSAELPAHRALAGAGVILLEGLVLDEVPAGDYELIALPLRLAGMDASPVRAVLRSLG